MTLLVAVPVSLVKVVAAVLFAPFGPNIVFAVALALIATLDPDVFVTVGVESVIPRGDDIAFARRQLLVYRWWRRNVDVETEIRRVSRKRGA
jgi:hypothetical protein